MKIATIVGARPQFIKASVVSRAIEEHRKDLQEVLIHTGQHYDGNMSDVFFDEMDIPKPDYHLGIGGGSHGQNTGRMIEQIESVLNRETPNLVLVYGDTDSTLAGALAAVKMHITVAHVEAGLRSFNRRMPEEINRVLTDHMSNILFTPTDTATANLDREGISGEKVRQVGDVMYDATIYYSQSEKTYDVLDQHGLESNGYILATIHRAENTDDESRLKSILEGFSNAPAPVVWPIHPRARKQIEVFGLELPECVVPLEPVGYLEMLELEKHSRLIATDSGGVQKEAFFHGVPCVTLREETEWVELVEQGWNRLIHPSDLSSVEEALRGFKLPDKKSNSLFGDGNAGTAIALAI